MPKPTLNQMRDVFDALPYGPRKAAFILRSRGFQVSNNAMRQFARGKTSCPPSIYRELLTLKNEV